MVKESASSTNHPSSLNSQPSGDYGRNNSDSPFRDLSSESDKRAKKPKVAPEQRMLGVPPPSSHSNELIGNMPIISDAQLEFLRLNGIDMAKFASFGSQKSCKSEVRSVPVKKEPEPDPVFSPKAEAREDSPALSAIQELDRDQLQDEPSSDVFSEYEDEEASDFDEPTPKKTKSDRKKLRRAAAKNAQEYVARLYEKEDAKEALKRKREEEQTKAQKTQKTSGKSKTKTRPNESGKAVAELLGGNVHDTAPNTNLEAMPDIQATTMAEQHDQNRRCIPTGCDTRHATTQRRDLKEAAKIFGFKKVKAVNGNFLLSGMQSALRPYQLVASSWMVKRELARTEPYGGLVADQMGMGKTVVSLNTIIGNPPSKQDIEDYSGATLIVVPNREGPFSGRGRFSSTSRSQVWFLSIPAP